MDDYLEEEYKPAFAAWRQNQTPEGNAAFLQVLDPIVQKGIKLYGGDSPVSLVAVGCWHWMLFGSTIPSDRDYNHTCLTRCRD